MEKEIVSFIRRKDYKLVKELGRGGLGKTFLLLDQEMAEQFVCKKYSPYYEGIKDQYYEYFKNEIKVMFQVNHPNIVRIFNYYLYPEFKTGYILMEYIDGESIYEYLKANQSQIDYIFEQTIDAFLYLENHQILHRDIRRENILITNDGQVKVIDFGFGKKVYAEDDTHKSISLNWWCEIPNDFNENQYDHCTELYFIGKLFERIILDGVEDWTFFSFKYKAILERMVKVDPHERFNSFSEVKERIIEYTNSFDDLFSYEEKEIYKTFAEYLTKSLESIDEDAKYNTEHSRIVAELESIYKANVLEDEVQNTRDVIRIFINGSYRFYNSPIFSCHNLRDILQLLNKSGPEKATILLLNIQNRLNQVKRTVNFDADIPF